MGQYGLGVRNERGDRLIEFCKEENLTIKNTYYDLHPRRLYTWKSPQDNPLRVVRNQIDYFLIKRRFQNNITRVAAYPGADIASDHNPIIGDFKYKGKIIKERRNTKRYNIRTLKEPDKRDNLIEALKESFEANMPSDDQTEEECWKTIETNIKATTEKALGYIRHEARKPWMTKEILNRMEDRRIAKLENNDIKYKQINKDIRNKIRQAKEQWLTEQCHEAERLHEMHDSFNFHRKFKEITSCYNKRNVSSIRHNNKIITDNEQLRLTWENYIKDLYQNVRPAAQNLTQQEDITGPQYLFQK
ncbi:hypothetical protein WA026_006507 [Henosepilachna vigintioctopunctata]|uniref:Endonuclease-reverse transcriptase n=1 Tax=Henosepilachna vigintioctopunctata TaxID=420089 RepID=A0AAW1UGV9_9CUCU